MAARIVVPRLGWSMDEGTFSEWLKKDGAFVRAGEMLFVLEGDKATQEVESFDSGYLHLPPEAPRPGDTVVVGQLLGYLLAKGEAAPGDTPESGSPIRGAEMSSQESACAAPADAPQAGPAGTGDDPARRPVSRPVATPRARRTAAQLGIDWTRLSGSGRGGRIRERDVLAHARKVDPNASSH